MDDQQHLEYIPFPAQEPILRFPLNSVVEVVTEHDPGVSPEEHVTSFLETHAHLFSAVEDSWRQVKVAQEAYKAFIEEQSQKTKTTNRSRDARRRGLRVTRDFRNTNVIFGTCKNLAGKVYRTLMSQFDDTLPIITANHEVVKFIEEGWKDQVAHFEEGLEEQEMPGDARRFISQMNRIQSAITGANVYALYWQNLALQHMQEFLGQDDTVPEFMRQVKALALTKDSTYPGFLELLATHTAQDGQDNMLLAALRRTAPVAASFSEEFLNDVYNKQERLPKELSAAMAIMQLASRITAQECGMDEEVFRQHIAQRSAEWPVELLQRLTTYAEGKTWMAWTSIKDALEPFIRQGRLPAQMSTRAVDTSDKRRTGNANPKIPSPESSANANFTLARNNKLDHADLITVPEKEPISHFAALVSKGDKSGMKFELLELANVEEVFEFTNLNDYISHHKGDPTLRNVLEKALDHLIIDPYDPACTVRLKGVTYQLQDASGARERTPRRFSPQHFPGIHKGVVAAKTRIIYDILNVGSHSALVLYGAFIKQDIETMSKLPPIR